MVNIEFACFGGVEWGRVVYKAISMSNPTAVETTSLYGGLSYVRILLLIFFQYLLIREIPSIVGIRKKKGDRRNRKKSIMSTEEKTLLLQLQKDWVAMQRHCPGNTGPSYTGI